MSFLTGVSAWHTTYIDLVIHAPPKSSGSLLRLLKSIQAADYFGARLPHITIELPAEIDPPTLDFLDNLVWPPIDLSGAPHASQVTLRHRLPRYGFTTEEAATHFIESFYPARSRESHVLLLSPQTELSPIYYHYIMYNVLEYQYSRYGQQAHQSENLMGISLELPSSYLNYSKQFEPPTLNLIKSNDSPDKSLKHTPFLWQAPNSNAALYFGEKWIELHSYLSSRISLQDPELPENRRPPARQKIISEYFPAWMEYVQELMRARGYSLLYPNFAGSNDAIATVHDELYQPPEEYTPSRPRSSPAPIPTINPNEPFTADPATHLSNRPSSPESPLLVSSLLSLLPEPGDLPELAELPFLAFDGNALSPSLSESTARSFAEEFRREIGGCKDSYEAIVEPMSADDLFCSLNSSEDVPSAGKDPKSNGHQKEDKKTDNEPRYKQSSLKGLDGDTAQKSSHRQTGRRAQGRVGASTEAKHRQDDSLPPADQSKEAQNEFTEHLKRQGVKSANKTPVKVGGKNKIPNASLTDPKPHEGKKVTKDGESDTEFQTVNGNLVRKKAKDSDQNTLGKEENIPLAEPTLDIATSATVSPKVTATTEEKGQDQLEKKDSRPAKAQSKDPAGAAGVPVVRDRGW